MLQLNEDMIRHAVVWSGFHLSVEKQLVLRLLRFAIGLENSPHFFIQSGVKPINRSLRPLHYPC